MLSSVASITATVDEATLFFMDALAYDPPGMAPLSVRCALAVVVRTQRR